MSDPGPHPADLVTLERTRSAVLNVMIAAGLGIALSGWLLRWLGREAGVRARDQGLRQGLMAGLLGLVAVSFVVRRTVAGRGALRDRSRRERRFYAGHVLAAAIGALAVPLGLAYGWLIRPRLDAVAPFWVAALALGLLALPRTHELEGLDEPEHDQATGEPQS
jgi:hypothetical protein